MGEREERKETEKERTEHHFPQTPYTVTVRRNPPRRARPTPSTIRAPDPSSLSLHPKNIRPFPTVDLDSPSPTKCAQKADDSNTLQVFLRVRPVFVRKDAKKVPRGQAVSRPKGVPDKDKRMKKKTASLEINVCLTVNDARSVTLTMPSSMVDTKRTKMETYDGFSHVFPPDACQKEVYERVMAPLVAEFLDGKSRLLAAMGPTGSGKTHTVFGSPREPGLVPLALRRIFSGCNGGGTSELPRVYYLSMFEISSERKAERIHDLSPDGGDLCLQQGSIKGLQEMMVSDVKEAECFIARGMLKRATATTNANNKSSRSQCIINIRSASKVADQEDEFLEGNAVMTIVDLAGAEKERRTGNQGIRLVESNFINNTSMVFGLCLRSLLEHQKSKRPLQKHYQNSLLTRYLRDHLEGKKHMTLILTVKPGEEDYLDTSFLLRQSSPYVNIKFNNVEEQSNMACQKRHLPIVRMEQGKRRKCNNLEASVIDGGNGSRDAITHEKETLQASASSPSSITAEVNKHGSLNDEYHVESKRKDRNDQVMREFSKALWNVLKQYKKKLEVAENEVQSLKESLAKEKMQVLKLEEELKDLRSSSSLNIQPSSSNALSDLELDDAAACPTGPRLSAQQLDQNVHKVFKEKLTAKNVGSFVGRAHEAGEFGAPELLRADYALTNVAVPIASSSQSLVHTEDSSCELPSSLGPNTLAGEDETEREACSNVSKWRSDLEVPESFVEQNWKISTQMESYDIVILDSTLSMEDFKPPGNQGMNQNLDSFPETKYETEDLDGAVHVDANDSSSLVDVKGCTPLASAESSQLHANSCAVTSSVMKSILDKEQDTGMNQNLGNFPETKCETEDVDRAGHLDANGCSSLVNVTGCAPLALAESSSLHANCCAETSSVMKSTFDEEQETIAITTDEASRLHNQSSAPKSENQVAYSCILPVEEIVKGENNREVPNREEECDSLKSLKVEKPRRRLLPASSILVKEIGGIDMEVENPKRRGEKKPNTYDKGYTQGNVSLVRLLKRNIPV